MEQMKQIYGCHVIQSDLIMIIICHEMLDGTLYIEIAVFENHFLHLFSLACLCFPLFALK